jgi:type 1 glutamine amidotransferase
MGGGTWVAHATKTVNPYTLIIHKGQSNYKLYI